MRSLYSAYLAHQLFPIVSIGQGSANQREGES